MALSAALPSAGPQAADPVNFEGAINEGGWPDFLNL